MKGFATENLRKISLISCFVGLVVPIALFLVARQQAPYLIIVLFIGWLSAPSVAFLLGHCLSKRWSARARRSLYLVNILATLVAMGVYLYQTMWPRQVTPAFYWVAVPPAIIVISLTTVGIAGLSGRGSTPQTLT